MSEHLDFYLPMDLATRKLYHQWIRGMLASNTFLVLPDLFIHARTAALLSFNFLQYYPASSVLIVNAEKEKDGICAQLKAVGISLQFIHQIKDDKQFKKQCADGVAGVYFVTTKTMINMLGKNSLNNFDFKLMVVCGAEKADSTSGLAKVVSGSFGAGKIFRVLALSFALPKKIAKVQSLTLNLQINRMLIKKTNDPDVGEILFNCETAFKEFKYESRELELLQLIVTMCVENLIHAGIICTRNLQSLFYIDTEIWLKELPEDSEHKNLLDFTVTMIEGYKLLIQYGPRALFLYFSSKSDVLENVEANDEMKELNERLKIVDFPAFPGTKKRTELNCHPKFVELFNVVNTDKRNENYIVFCSSPFGARAVTEFLTASRVGCIENTFNFYDLMKDKPHLRGEEPFEPENAKAEFFRRPNTPVMVSTNLVDNLGVIIVERTVSMDYLVGGLRYTRFGRKSWCLLTEGYESIPKSMINYERRLSSTDISHNYNFNTVTSKLKIEKLIRIHPIQYSVADLDVGKECNTAAAASTTTKDDSTVVKNTEESVQKGEIFLKSLIGDFTMDHLDNAFNDTVEFLNEHTLKNPLWIENYIKNAKTNKNSTPFENALHSAIYDPINPQHISFALNLPDVQFAEWEEEDDKEQEEQPQPSKPKKIKKINSKKSVESSSPESAKPVNHYFQAIKDPKLEEIVEKMHTRRMYERQRWLCVLRDAAKAGQFVAVQKEVMEEVERLPSDFQFWDYV